MSPVLQTAAVLCSAFGVVAAVVVLTRSRSGQLAVAVLLEFLLAAGLLRLADDPSPSTVGATALLVAIRQVVTFGLRSSAPR